MVARLVALGGEQRVFSNASVIDLHLHGTKRYLRFIRTVRRYIEVLPSVRRRSFKLVSRLDTILRPPFSML